MHLMITHGNTVDPAAAQTLAGLRLPQLERLLSTLKPCTLDAAATPAHAAQVPDGADADANADELAPLMPHETLLAAWRGEARAPSAAWLAQAAGLDPTLPWALLTPLHLAVGTDSVSALPPRALQLDEATSRALFSSLCDSLSALRPASTPPMPQHWLSPDQWLLAVDELDGAQAASIDRVLGRSVEPWLPVSRVLRRLQNELQMLLHAHPLNEQRESCGERPVNSVWISGCGRSNGRPLPADLHIDSRLREPLLDSDWERYFAAWQALDAGPLKALLEAHQASNPVRLTVCGERRTRSWAARPGSPWQRLRDRVWRPAVDAGLVLASL